MTRLMTATVLMLCAGGAWGMGDEPVAAAECLSDHDHHTIPGSSVRGCGKAQFAAQMIKSGFGPGGESSYPPAIRASSTLTDTDLTHVDLEIEVFFNVSELAGTSTMHLDSLVDGLSTFTFQLGANFIVPSVLVDGVAASITTSALGERVVTLPVTYNAGDSFVVEVEYNGATVSGFFGSIEWGMIADRVDPRDQDPSLMVYTLSQPYFSYTWWPCKDTVVGGPGDYSDKFTIDMSITADEAYSSTANGLLQSVDTLSGSRKRFNYSHAYEIPTYLVAFATSEFNTYQQTWNYGDVSMPLDVWFTNANDGQMQQDEWFKMGDMLTVFSDLWGVYPFHTERYGMYEFGFPGGMEHQTNTGQIGWFFADWLTAHEAAHQWWGDWVTCKTWHDIWFQEGMASYAEVLYEEFKPGVLDPDFQRINLMSGDYQPWQFDGSAYVYDASDADRMFAYNFTYLRGGWVWHMIRGLTGDAAFFQGLEDFAAWYAESGATTEDILAAMNASTGMDFTELFADYVYGSGAPEFEFGWTTTNVNGQDYLRLMVAQSQDVSEGSGGVFNTPIPITINGNETFAVEPGVRTHFFTIPTSSATGFLEFDPENWVLKRFAAEGLPAGAPPVVVEASADELSASFTFIEQVHTSAALFSVLTDDPIGEPQAFSYIYSNGSHTATLGFGAGLAPGDYVVTVSDTIVSQGSLVALDGDGGNNAVPSGNGEAGGDFLFRFTVENPCLADTNGDGFLDIGDVGEFVGRFLASDPRADMNGDGILDIGDVSAFVGLFLAGC